MYKALSPFPLAGRLQRHRHAITKVRPTQKLIPVVDRTTFLLSQFPRRTTPLNTFSPSRAFSNNTGYNPNYRRNTYASAQTALWTLITLNALVFATWQYATYAKNLNLRRLLYENATLSKINWHAGRYYTALTSAFSHIEPFHFIFNMFALHAFGSILSIVPGVGGFHVAALTIGSGLAGSLAFLWHLERKETSKVQSREGSNLWDRFTGGGRELHRRVVEVGLGASGLVMGAGAAATCLMPFMSMSLMFIPIPIPLWVITGAYFAIDAYYLDAGDQVGHAAHLGGGIFGFVYYFAYLRKFGGIWQFRQIMRRR